MHNNYYFLRKLVVSLKEKLVGLKLIECFSQDRDELILVFGNENTIFYFKAHLRSEFSCLAFPENFNRAKKNNIDLFPELIEGSIVNLQMVLNDRGFLIHFDNNHTLLFKLHGNRANIICFDKVQKTVVSLFKNNLPNDKNLKIDELDRVIERTYENFSSNEFNYQKLFPTFGKEVKAYLERLNFFTVSDDKKWEILQLVDAELKNANQFYITEQNDQLELSILKEDHYVEVYSDPIKAITQFFFRFVKDFQFRKEKNRLIKSIEKRIGQVESYLAKTKSKLVQIDQEAGHQQLADIIMANLHQIPSHAVEVKLFNFYTNQDILVKLKKNLSPQKFAENLYRKAKNQKKELDQLNSNIQSKEAELAGLMRQWELVEAASIYGDLKPFMQEEKILDKKKDERLPYKTFEFQGFEIWVGKNAKANDTLTLKHSFKDDLWLHAKDVSGSHVLIKYKSGQNFPNDVIERAAQLAAYHSKRKTDTLCPVIVTPKKFVRKAKGLPPGKVIVEREEVIMVVPSLELY